MDTKKPNELLTEFVRPRMRDRGNRRDWVENVSNKAGQLQHSWIIKHLWDEFPDTSFSLVLFFDLLDQKTTLTICLTVKIPLCWVSTWRTNFVFEKFYNTGLCLWFEIHLAYFLPWVIPNCYFFLSSCVFFLSSLTRLASFKASSEFLLMISSKCHMSFSLSSPHHFVHVFCANKNGVYDPNRNIIRLTSGNAYHFFPTFILLFICHFNKFCGFIFRSKTKPASLRTSNFLVITETLDRRPIAASHVILWFGLNFVQILESFQK